MTKSKLWKHEVFVSSSRRKKREKEKKNRREATMEDFNPRECFNGDPAETTGEITDEIQVCVKALVLLNLLSISYQYVP